MKNNKYVVDKNIELLDYLKQNVSGSKNNIKNLLVKKYVFVNDKVQTKYNYLLKKDDIVEIKNTKIESKNNIKLDIIYEDKDLIVVNKPAGILTISTEKEKEITIYHMVMEYLKKINKNNKVFIIHRLDKDTSGVLLFAKNEKTKNLFQNNWNDIVKKRKYYAICNGIFNKKKDVIKSYLKENKSFIVYSSNDKVHGKLAITEYEVIKEKNNLSLIDINIKTGRKNQIRVHMNDINHSILGDKKYGESKKIKRLYLHAYLLEIIDPRTKKTIVFKTKIPKEFQKIM
jgi:23S rRNA pseudouridine1911/1915/1917 synthase